MGNLTDELEFDRETNCNELKNYKNQNYITNSSTSKIPKKDFDLVFQRSTRVDIELVNRLYLQ